MAANKTLIALRVPDYILDKIDKEAEEKGYSRSEVIRYILAEKYNKD